jgi:tRNA pseudouridine38-40 synthase
VPHRFHARHDAVARRYVYQIARRRTAFAKNYVWWVKDPIDVARMRDAAQRLVGRQDFRSFAAADREDEDARSTQVLVERVDVVEAAGLVLIAIEGSHFIWKMVRRIVGVLVEVGRGGLDAAAITAFLAAESSSPAKLTAPPSGLFLERVYYKGDRRISSVGPITPLQSIE